jgi:hypothetical protein
MELEHELDIGGEITRKKKCSLDRDIDSPRASLPADRIFISIFVFCLPVARCTSLLEVLKHLVLFRENLARLHGWWEVEICEN